MQYSHATPFEKAMRESRTPYHWKGYHSDGSYYGKMIEKVQLPRPDTEKWIPEIFRKQVAYPAKLSAVGHVMKSATDFRGNKWLETVFPMIMEAMGDTFKLGYTTIGYHRTDFDWYVPAIIQLKAPHEGVELVGEVLWYSSDSVGPYLRK